MPVYDFQCVVCGRAFEELVRLGETPNCPACGAGSPKKLLSVPSAPGSSQSLVQSARRQAAREGHFSNYSARERNKVPR